MAINVLHLLINIIYHRSSPDFDVLNIIMGVWLQSLSCYHNNKCSKENFGFFKDEKAPKTKDTPKYQKDMSSCYEKTALENGNSKTLQDNLEVGPSPSLHPRPLHWWPWRKKYSIQKANKSSKYLVSTCNNRWTESDHRRVGSALSPENLFVINFDSFWYHISLKRLYVVKGCEDWLVFYKWVYQTRIFEYISNDMRLWWFTL